MIILVVGGGVVWFVNRPKPATIDDGVTDKANRLTQQAVEAHDQEAATQVDLPDDTGGLQDMRGGG